MVLGKFVCQVCFQRLFGISNKKFYRVKHSYEVYQQVPLDEQKEKTALLFIQYLILSNVVKNGLNLNNQKLFN
jgi:hypothetical protein